jgi:adenylate cyclase
MKGVYKRARSASSARRSRVERRLAAILGADIAGYSLLMGRADEDTHRRVGTELDRVIRDIEKSHGRVFSFGGDGLMAEFPSAVEALKCALRIQADAAKRNVAVKQDDRILFRIGINAGEIVVQQERAGGNAVNVAARLEGVAEPGGIALSDAVFQQVGQVVSAGYVLAGPQRLKNIREPVSVHLIPAANCGSWGGMPALPRQTQAHDTPGAATEYRASLAVLPFRTLQEDQSDAYFAEGMVDDIIRALGGLKDVLVIARSSTQTFAGAPLDLRRVGHDLDVRYVLHGRVRQAQGALRIAVELCEAQTGTIVWVDRFDGGTNDLFELQDRIAMRVARSIAPHLRERELSRVLRKHPDSMTAYDLTLQALDLFHRAEGASLERCGALLERAIRADPHYGPAYSHLAALRMRVVGQGWSADTVADRTAAADLARAAIAREPSDAVALAICGHVQAYLLKEYAAARRYLDMALEFGPSCALAWAYSSLTWGYLEEHDKAIVQAERALRLAPIGPDTFRYEAYLAQAYYLANRLEEALAWARMSAARAPGFTSNIICLIASNVALNNIDAARISALNLLGIVPKFRLATFRDRTPVPANTLDRLIERLRQAGLPE